MDNYEPKKLLILRILQILADYSDCEHRLKQNEIIAKLKNIYDIECERKAVARNIEYLIQAGYEIIKENDGVYLAVKKFETCELRLLIDAVLANRNICKTHTKELIKKLTEEGGVHFKDTVKHVVNLDDWQKDDNADYFFNIDILCEAIEKKVKIEFTYNSYGADKKLHSKRAKKTVANPYQLFLKNGRYYLACNYDGYDNILYCRIDKMTEIGLTNLPAKPITEIEGCENGINLGKLSNRLPYAFVDTPQLVEFVTVNGAADMINHVLDWFGRDVNITELPDGNVKFSLYAGLSSMRFWLLQFGTFVKVISPKPLVEQIKSDIEAMRKFYGE